ncbi:MAG: hypothetical protein K8W52_47320 [Deltaproteobacteria bacterium]|nr:hypothetical protein [Deltaproteobacteria bacterium]
MGVGLGVIIAVLVVLAVLAVVRPKEAPPGVAGAPAGTRTARVDALLAGLADPDPLAWSAGARDLARAAKSGQLTPGEVVALLHAAVTLAPLDAAHDPQEAILTCLFAIQHDDEFLAVLEKSIPHLREPSLRPAYAMLVQRISGVDAFLRLANRDPEHASYGLRQLSRGTVATSSAQRDSVLAMARNPRLVDDVAWVALDWVRRGIVRAPALALRGEDFVRGYRTARARLAAARAAHDHDVDSLTTTVGIYLDLVGRLAPAVVANDLDAAARDRDPAVAVFAVISIVRGGRTPDAAALDAVVRHDRARWVLLQLLSAGDQQSLIPARWRTQEVLARTELAHWLSFPSELGTWPDEMELMNVVSVDAEGGAVLDMYVFKFRMKAPHRTASRGWMAGVSGPYVRGEPPRLGGANTFSSMEPADSRTAEEHAGRVAEILAQWRAAHGRG